MLWNVIVKVEGVDQWSLRFRVSSHHLSALHVVVRRPFIFSRGNHGRGVFQQNPAIAVVQLPAIDELLAPP